MNEITRNKFRPFFVIIVVITLLDYLLPGTLSVRQTENSTNMFETLVIQP